MRGTVLLLLVVTATVLAGCATAEERPALRAFSALYEDKDGNRFRVELRGPEQVLGPDGQARLAYILATRGAGPGGERWGERLQALGPDLRPVRESGCYAMSEGEATCQHHHIDFVPYYDVPDWGVGYPYLATGKRDGDLLRIPDPRVDPADDPQATSYFEYRVGQLWPERYLRAAPEWDFEETLVRLESVEAGEPLVAIPAWPAAAPPAGAAAVADLFPGADTRWLDVPFTVAEAVAALREHDASRQAMDGACIVGIHIWADRPSPDQPLPLPQVALTRRTGSMWIQTLGRTGMQDSWTVYQEQDVLGQATLQVDANGNPFHSSATCMDREAAVVPMGDFLAAVPDSIAQGRLGGLSITWSRETPQGTERSSYTVQYEPEPEGQAHWRSASLSAGTGRWAGFTFLAGDQLDPPTAAEPEQNG